MNFLNLLNIYCNVFNTFESLAKLIVLYGGLKLFVTKWYLVTRLQFETYMNLQLENAGKINTECVIVVNSGYYRSWHSYS